MNLNNTEHALLIILSIFLAIFLVLGIVTLVYFLSLLMAIKRTRNEIVDAINKTTKITNIIKSFVPIVGVLKYLSKFNKDKKVN